MSLIDDAKRPEAARTPLQDNPRRRYGPQTSSLTVCAKHGEAYPVVEQCPLCLGWQETPVEPEDVDHSYDWADGMWP